ncbi:hypothetical protein, partial [Brevibacterium paucivorans]|uniref:hypothetical protein n=1 Tax=Brevibacterium paucivorans TaxID=170994 RepID=UPI0011AED8B6
RATAANPTGVIRRRHIATRGRTVIGLEDDVLDLDALTAAERDDLHGEGALMAALESHRTFSNARPCARRSRTRSARASPTTRR